MEKKLIKKFAIVVLSATFSLGAIAADQNRDTMNTEAGALPTHIKKHHKAMKKHHHKASKKHHKAAQ